MIYFNSISIHSELLTSECYNTLKNHLWFLGKMPQKFVLCVTANSSDQNIKGMVSFKDFVSQINDWELKGLMITILTSSTFYIGNVDDGYKIIGNSEEEIFPSFGIYLQVNEGLDCILSLSTEVRWLTEHVTLTFQGEDKQYINFPPVSYQNFLDGLNAWEEILKYCSNFGGSEQGYLPRSGYLFSIMPDWLMVLYERDIKDPMKKIACIRGLGTFVAKMNGYSLASDIINKNANCAVIRDIFINRRVGCYISTDIQHGRFELLDLNGKHMGEIDFLGCFTKKKDSTGKHDINV